MLFLLVVVDLNCEKYGLDPSGLRMGAVESWNRTGNGGAAGYVSDNAAWEGNRG